jgi:hypothetical protein
LFNFHYSSAKALVKGNLPFQTVENDTFREHVKMEGIACGNSYEVFKCNDGSSHGTNKELPGTIGLIIDVGIESQIFYLGSATSLSSI